MPAKQSDPKPVKPRKAWVVVRPGGGIMVESIRNSKGRAEIAGVAYGPDTLLWWSDMEAKGYRVVRVVIQEETG